MLKDTRITWKFPIIMISFALFSAMTFGLIAYFQSTETLYNEAKSKLFALMESRSSAVFQYIETVERDLDFHAQSDLVKNAITEFSGAWKEVPGDKTKYLHEHYINQNPYQFGHKGKLLFANDDSRYSKVHGSYHGIFTSIIAARELYDIFLVDKAGNIIYTAIKETDFATNVSHEESIGLKIVFDKVVKNLPDRRAVFSDFTPYAASQNKPAGFAGMAILGNKEQFLGVLIFQLSIDSINSIMQVTAGMGETGETYLVGSDFVMRSDSRFLGSSSILKTKVDTEAVHRAFSGEKGVKIIQDYRDKTVYSAYMPIDFLGIQWALLAEIDQVEILEPVYKLNTYLTIVGMIIAICISIFGYLLASDLSRPIMTMIGVMDKLAEDDLSVNISVSDRKDEVGLMAGALMKFKAFAIERKKLREELGHIAKHDSLTGLPNRKYALEYLEKLTDKCSQNDETVSIMFADLNNFKTINDTYGHQFGDQVLTNAAKSISACVRDHDMVARIGGDEFLIIISNVEKRENCEQIARKLIDAIEKSFSSPDRSLHLGVSIGIASFPDQADNIKDLLRMADEAMYKSKGARKSSFEFYKPVSNKLHTETASV